ncbi:hypothetical protein D3C86_1318430 [compost metagenome]
MALAASASGIPSVGRMMRVLTAAYEFSASGLRRTTFEPGASGSPVIPMASMNSGGASSETHSTAWMKGPPVISETRSLLFQVWRRMSPFRTSLTMRISSGSFLRRCAVSSMATGSPYLGEKGPSRPFLARAIAASRPFASRQAFRSE